MQRKSISQNYGFFQGRITSPIFSPYQGLAKVNACVRDCRKNPVTGKRTMHTVDFTAYGDVATDLISSYKPDAVIFVWYRLESNLRINKNTGIGAFCDDRVIVDFSVRESKPGKTEYLNCGILQGTFSGITKIPDTDGVYTLSVSEKWLHGEGKTFHRITVYGKTGEYITGRFEKGEVILVEYKVECQKKTDKDGRNKYYINYVLTGVA